MSIIPRNEIVEAFEHLDFSREMMNPMEAALDFKHMFDWSRSQRAKVFGAWAETFDGESSVDDRVSKSNLQEEMA